MPLAFLMPFSIYFHVSEVKCNPRRLFASTFAALPVLAAILSFSISIVFDRNLLSKCFNDAYFRSQEVETF